MEADNAAVDENDIDGNLWSLSHGDDEFQTPPSPSKSSMDVETAVREVVHAFRAAAEREITLGDGLDVWILSSSNSTGDADNSANGEGNTQDIEIKKYDNKLLSMKIEKRHFSLPRH